MKSYVSTFTLELSSWKISKGERYNIYRKIEIWSLIATWAWLHFDNVLLGRNEPYHHIFSAEEGRAAAYRRDANKKYFNCDRIQTVNHNIAINAPSKRQIPIILKILKVGNSPSALGMGQVDNDLQLFHW